MSEPDVLFKNMLKIMTFLKQNWFKLSILISVVWLLTILSGRINIGIYHDGEIQMYHRGWIEDCSPGILPPLPGKKC